MILRVRATKKQRQDQRTQEKTNKKIKKNLSTLGTLVGALGAFSCWQLAVLILVGFEFGLSCSPWASDDISRCALAALLFA